MPKADAELDKSDAQGTRRGARAELRIATKRETPAGLRPRGSQSFAVRRLLQLKMPFIVASAMRKSCIDWRMNSGTDS